MPGAGYKQTGDSIGAHCWLLFTGVPKLQRRDIPRDMMLVLLSLKIGLDACQGGRLHEEQQASSRLTNRSEDKARNRPVRPRIDEASGLPLFKVTIADPAAEKNRDKSITVEIAAHV